MAKQRLQISYLAAACLCLLMGPPFHEIAVAQDLKNLSIALDPVSFGNAGQVKFNPGPPEPVNVDQRSLQAQNLYETSDHVYEILLDPSRASSDPKSNSLWFELDTKRKDNNQQWQAFTVKAEPVGPFEDALSHVTVKIRNGSQQSIAEVRVPLHSTGYDKALELVQDPDQRFLVVSLSDPNPPKLDLRNNLHDFSLHLSSVDPQPQCTECWAKVPLPGSPIEIKQNSHDQVPLNIKPRPIQAMLASALVLKKDAPHEVLPVVVWYSADDGGLPIQKTLKVLVRFNPPFWQILLAVLLGSIVGIILEKVLDSASAKITARLVFKNIFIAGVAVFLAVVAVTFDSKFVILGFDMDPRQAVPALILAATVTGGPTVVKWALGVIHP